MDIIQIGWPDITALATVMAIDVALAGDNALVVGMAAAGLAPRLRRRAILVGIGAAAVLRVLFAAFTVRLLNIVGLTAAGGLLLLWVAWKLWRELRSSPGPSESVPATDHSAPGKTLRHAVSQIIIADLSMSLDNVLAVAGAARDHFWVLVVGLGLSVVLMGIAASLLARIIHRYRWVAYGGVLVVLYVALAMIWDGSHSVLATLPQHH